MTRYTLHRLSQFTLALIALIVITGCSDQAAETARHLEQVEIALNWFPEAEHGGYYAALVHGYYQAADVDVAILGGGPDAPVIQRVATGQVEFGVTNADGVLNARAAGAPVVALMAPYQINPRCIVVHAHSGFTSVKDLRGVTLALSQRPAFAHFLRHYFSFDDVTFVPYHGGVASFIDNPDYAQQGYVFSEPVIARRKGADPSALLVAEIGFTPYASLLITSEKMVEQRPELVRTVTAAAVEGWRTYLDAPLRTNELIHSKNPEMDMEILAEGARMSQPLVIDSVAAVEGLGHMSTYRWRQLHRQMVSAGILDSAGLDPALAHTVSFLPKASSEIP